MGETYISCREEKGSINISEDVISSMVRAAVAEVEGVAGLSNTAGAEIAELIGLKTVTKGVKVQLNDDRIVVDTIITVQYGCKIVDRRAQRLGVRQGRHLQVQQVLRGPRRTGGLRCAASLAERPFPLSADQGHGGLVLRRIQGEHGVPQGGRRLQDGRPRRDSRRRARVGRREERRGLAGIRNRH